MSSPVGAVPGNAHAVGDASARARIRTDLGTSLVVVAGAGTGKTTELVGRVIDLVTHGTALREVAAITFTEAAAAELRSRLRDSLAAALSAAPSDTRLATALDEVDEAAICTLHAFAQRMLVEHCISVGLAPGFEVLDDVADVAEFEDRWSRFADALLDDPSAEPTLTRAFALGLQPRDLEAVAFELHANWDRVDDGMIAGARPEEKGHAAHPAPVDPAPVLETLDRVVESAAWCTDAADLLLRHIEGCLASARGRILAAGGDDLAVVQLLRTTRRFSCRNGNRDNWGGRAAEVRSLCDEAEEARLWALGVARVSVVGWLLTRLACFTLEAADERRREGRITFHDLLVLARRLLRTDAHATAALRRRYRRILVDEFQDSDPIQVELAARLAAVVAGRDDLAATRPGALFVVGDPKQAIYRFRRADIEMFDHVAHRVGERVELHTNFRSVPGILAYVNAVFAELLGDGEPGQAAHVDLVAWRPRLPGEVPVPGPVAAPSPPRPVQLAFDMAADTGGDDAPREPTRAAPAGPAPVVVLGGRHEVPAAEVRRAAALDAATALRQVVETGWAVAERGADPGSGPDGVITRRARWGDIAVLIPTRASLPPLSEALDELDVPYRLEGGALLWGSDEVRDVLAVLRAADDPTDAVAVVGALRTPGLACGDDDLVVWHQAGGRWDPRAAAPAGLDHHAVARAMAVIMGLHRARWWSEPSAMVAAALEATHAFELALAHRRPRDRWHRLRWLLDQARRFDETNAGTLRAFLHWAAIQEAGDGRSGGIGPPDPDDDAVRVMTIHGAKGLEFPVVLVTGLERDGMGGHAPPRVVWAPRPGTLEVSFGHDIATADHADAVAREKELDAMEQVRLLYVAMTRARDHLLLCVHHGSTKNGLSERSHGAALLDLGQAHPGLWRTMPAPGTKAEHAAAGEAAVRPDAGGVESWVAELESWTRRRSGLLARLRRQPVATATAVAEEHGRRHLAGPARDGAPAPSAPAAASEPDPGRPDAADAPWRQGDEPLLIGRAVHSALAAVDLRRGTDDAGLPAGEVARHRARALGVEGRADEVAAMVERALGCDIVRRAAQLRHHKELYVVTPLGAEGVFEGFVDLLVDEGDGLVVVDYKTDRVTGPARAQAIARHRIQVAAYANAVEAITERPVTRCVLVFVGDDEPFEDVLAGQELRRARSEAAALATQMAGDVAGDVAGDHAGDVAGDRAGDMAGAVRRRD